MLKISGKDLVWFAEYRLTVKWQDQTCSVIAIASMSHFTDSLVVFFVVFWTVAGFIRYSWFLDVIFIKGVGAWWYIEAVFDWNSICITWRVIWWMALSGVGGSSLKFLLRKSGRAKNWRYIESGYIEVFIVLLISLIRFILYGFQDDLGPIFHYFE